MWMPTRSHEREYLDDHQPDQDVIDRIYRFLSQVNRYLGGTRATLARFEVLSRTWSPGVRIDVLDVATGAADVPRALIAWGRARGFDIHVTALDRSLAALSAARRAGPPDRNLRFLCGDVDHLPFPAGAFDYVTCALFFHHLTDDQIVAALHAFDRVAVRGMVVNDLIRRWRAWFWIRPRELQVLVDRARMPWLSIREHFGHRLTLAGDKTLDSRHPLRF
jgi:ubiquinone/menaquinone biosynthesis C-methylase UbiE